MARRRWNDRHENVSISQLFIHSSSAVVRGKFSMDDFSASFDRFTQRLRVTKHSTDQNNCGCEQMNFHSRMSSLPAVSKRLTPEFSVPRGISQGRAAARTRKIRCVVAEHAAGYPLGRRPAVQRWDQVTRSSQRITCAAVTSRGRREQRTGRARRGTTLAPPWQHAAAPHLPLEPKLLR